MKNLSKFLLAIIIFLSFGIMAQAQDIDNALPYREIPQYPETFAATTVAARVIDGLGFRYYWATEGLTETDLAYKPSDEGRTTRQTLEHIFGLTNVVKNASFSQVNKGEDVSSLSFEELRKRTLENIELASKTMKELDPEKISELQIIFPGQDSQVEFPYWNLLNGPLADAIYHVGQVVSFRRSSGNPISKKARMLTGKAAD